MNFRPTLATLLALSMSALVGCMSMPAGESPERAPREPRQTRAEGAAAAPPAGEAREARAGRAERAAPAAPPSRAESILAERRRGDYPEIAADETGFTITEQIRISGETVSRYDQALLLLRQERYREGIRILEQIVENAPEITAPHVELGIAYRQVGDLESAVEALEMAALLSPEHPIVHNELGIAYRRSGRFAEARAEYEKALDVFGDFHFARRNLAVLCDLYLADTQCALQNYEAYLAAAGDDPEVEIWLADLTNRLGVSR